MSRSRRKTPIFGMSTCRSERADKEIWHGRWRAHTRNSLSNVDGDASEGFLLPDRQEVSNIWTMGKDGRQWWPAASQSQVAHRLAESRGSNAAERAAIRVRLLRKWMAK